MHLGQRKINGGKSEKHWFSKTGIVLSLVSLQTINSCKVIRHGKKLTVQVL